MQEEPNRILITGANGFVGRHLLNSLMETDGEGGDEQIPAQIVASVQAEHRADAEAWTGQAFPKEQVRRIRWVEHDITDPAATGRLFATVRPQQVYHLAARASGADADREAVFAVNVGGTRRLLEAAAALTPLPRVLLISTGYIYGNTDPARPAREADPAAPLGRFGPYTDSKIEMEAVARGYSEFSLVARAFSHTGPGQTPTFALPSFARQLVRIELGLEVPLLHVGNLEAQRDMLDVRDVVRAYRLLMAHGAPGEVYNVATGSPHRMHDLLDRLRALCTVPTEVVVDPARLRPADIACSSGDPSRLWAATKWQPQFPLETTLRDMLAFWREATPAQD